MSDLDLDPVLGVGHKSVPPALWGRRASEVAAERRPVDEFATPLLVFDRAASDANVATLTAWAAERGLGLAPHGKTTMAPELWRRLLDAGCWGVTVATPWQAQVARAAGVDRILLANEVVDPVGATWLAAELDAHPDAELVCWVDSPESVAALAATAGERPIDVLVELGDTGGRTGARGVGAALAVADAVAAEPRLRLRGATGYEGSYGADRSPATTDRVRGYLAALAGFAGALLDAHDIPEPIVTAGGSTWFDLVAEELGSLGGRAHVILRSGAFQAHDDVFYTRTAALPFEPALTVFARVVSRPEPGLALLDAGKRDVPSDLDLPVVLQTASGRPVPGARVTALNDQHARVELPAGAELAVGEVVLLGVSHPCTAFDRWRLIPEVEHAREPDPRVVGFLPTVF
ncbi:alanine racemase [Protaetiibacter intestinalis]|uniref:Amino acid deaminase n=1 Tax=Protaetiibacter intestinalis TaxID=2419774 RepID=A0A387B403_9MICO|nr:alanine racemase [Protaetiibacter intestinalis]AYF97143.1 amino acid deaminase [Protaetiibacter intestinalis]